jgi:hypothetical protein
VVKALEASVAKALAETGLPAPLRDRIVARFCSLDGLEAGGGSSGSGAERALRRLLGRDLNARCTQRTYLVPRPTRRCAWRWTRRGWPFHHPQRQLTAYLCLMAVGSFDDAARVQSPGNLRRSARVTADLEARLAATFSLAELLEQLAAESAPTPRLVERLANASTTSGVRPLVRLFFWRAAAAIFQAQGLRSLSRHCRLQYENASLLASRGETGDVLGLDALAEADGAVRTAASAGGRGRARMLTKTSLSILGR